MPPPAGRRTRLSLSRGDTKLVRVAGGRRERGRLGRAHAGWGAAPREGRRKAGAVPRAPPSWYRRRAVMDFMMVGVVGASAVAGASVVSLAIARVRGRDWRTAFRGPFFGATLGVGVAAAASAM